MRRNSGVIVLLFFFSGCAAYKELTPIPEVTPAERGYIELRKDKENFQLEKGGKYYIAFPGPHTANFLLALRLDGKRFLRSSFSPTKPGEGGPNEMIPDEAAGNDTLSLFGLDAAPNSFYWVVDTVQMDMELMMRYRYVPRWRYTFELQYPGFREGLAGNIVDRAHYTTSDVERTYADLNYTQELVNLEVKSRSLAALHKDLSAMASLFPPDIAAKNDTAYQKYTSLKDRMEDEIQFQSNYASVLTIFQKEKESRGSVDRFLEAAPSFTAFMQQKEKYPKPITEKARYVFLDRLSQVVPFFEQRLKAKSDLSDLKIQLPLHAATQLAEACGQRAPADLQLLSAFADRFNLEAESVRSAGSRLRELDGMSDKQMAWTSDTLYGTLLARVEQIHNMIPLSQMDQYERYRSFPFLVLLQTEFITAGTKTAAYQSLYDAGRTTLHRIQTQDYPGAELKLRELHESREFMEFTARDAQRHLMIRALEDELVARVKLASQQRVDAFVARHELTIDNVTSLYADSAFLPVYQPTFSSAGQAQLLQNRKQIQDYLETMKTIRFPENAIRGIYGELTRAMSVRGAEKAHAIVEHGKFYRGNDRQVLAFVEECDPTVAKWVVRAREYRRVLALPVTNNGQGTNDYIFRIGLKIPTEAQFPVYDINIRLPRELAEKAGKTQWYDEITINKSPIKNEGRFRITSPTAENNYESLVTPVQMDKEGNNILEVKFRFPGLRVFEVSTMAQVPIIRKN